MGPHDSPFGPRRSTSFATAFLLAAAMRLDGCSEEEILAVIEPLVMPPPLDPEALLRSIMDTPAA